MGHAAFGIDEGGLVARVDPFRGRAEIDGGRGEVGAVGQVLLPIALQGEHAVTAPHLDDGLQLGQLGGLPDCPTQICPRQVVSMIHSAGNRLQ